MKNYNPVKDVKYNLGDKVILDGLQGYWEIVEIESYPDFTKRYVLRIKCNHKYKKTILWKCVAVRKRCED